MFEYLVFDEHVGMAFHREARIEVDGDSLKYRIDGFGTEMLDSEKGSGVYSGNAQTFLHSLEGFGVPSWKNEYVNDCLDGYSWGLRYKEVGKPCRKFYGFNKGPACYDSFVKLLFSVTKEASSV